jgi:1,3-beta-glucan synthase
MSSHHGPQSQEGLFPPSSSPSDSHDIIAHAPDPAYYEHDEYDPAPRRRDTMGSDGSDINESDRYYDHNGPYDPYGGHESALSVSSGG